MVGTKRMLQVTSHRKFNKNVRYFIRLFMFIFICFISGYTTIRHMFALTMLSGFVLKVKQLNGESYPLYWNLKIEFLHWRPHNETFSSHHANGLFFNFYGSQVMSHLFMCQKYKNRCRSLTSFKTKLSVLKNWCKTNTA